MLFVVITTHNTVWAQRIFVLKQVGAHSNHWLWLLCAPPGLTPEILRSAHTVYLCVVWIWEQTAIISLYSINWLVFITEMECVYCAVRTGSLYTASLTFSNSTFCPHSVFMCFVWIWEQTAIISLYSINWLVFITETECVYCAVRTGCLYTIQVIFWSLRGYAVTAAQLIHQSLKAGDFDARPRCKLHTLLSHDRRARYCYATQCNRMLS